MEEGFYWVVYANRKLIAWYSREETRHYETGELVSGVWYFAGSDSQIAIFDEVSVLEGPLAPPV